VTAPVSHATVRKKDLKIFYLERTVALPPTARATRPAARRWTSQLGECVQFQVQEFVAKTWRAVATTGCAALNSKSQATGYLNLDADSGFLSFMVEK
jgi:hypothetical protein